MDRIIKYRGYSFLADGPMGKRMLRGGYEKEELSLIKKIPHIENMNVLELGGCLGVVSTVVNKKLKNPEAHIVVEANPKLMRHLRHNKKLNDCKFKIENALVAEKHGGIFYSYKKLVAGSAHRKDNREKNKCSHKVNVINLRELMNKHKISFDLIILDIEGGELQFLNEISTNEKYKDLNLKYIMVEIHEHLMRKGFRRKCFNALRRLGMTRIAKNKNSFLYGKQNNDKS